VGSGAHRIEDRAQRHALESRSGQACVGPDLAADDSTRFLKAATASRRSPEYKELYFHLLRCFTDADATMTGVIDAEGFDKLIDIAAMAPRKYGFAPSAATMFKTERERKASRAALFKTVDKHGGGTISFDELLEWAFEHIGGRYRWECGPPTPL